MTLQTYQFYFDKVLNKRLKFIKNVALIIAIVISITLSLPYGKFWWNMALIVVRVPVLCLALLLIQRSRQKFSTVEFTKYKTFSEQIVRSVLSMKYAQVVLFYGLSALFVHLIFIFQLPLRSQYYALSKEYRQKPLVNDEWVFFWVSPVILGGLYGAIHLVFQRNILPFKYGVNRSSPDENLLNRLPRLFLNSLLMTTMSVILSPLIYLFIRPLIYKLTIVLTFLMGLDTSIPPTNFSIRSIANIMFVTFHVVFLWEAINHSYNVYATIGCMDGKKLISSYSADPIGTLLTGLKNAQPQYQLSRLTAFQELAYIATAKDADGVKLRTSVYNARSKNGMLWPAILKECSLVIKETTARINYRSPRDLKALQDSVKEQDRSNTPAYDDSSIFGNSIFVNAESVPYKDKVNNFDHPHPKKEKGKTQQFLENQVMTPLKSVLFTMFDSMVPTDIISSKTCAIFKDFVTISEHFYTDFLSSKLGIFFRVTLKRDTESRVLNPVNYGNAVIALSNFMLHSLDEDKNFFILNDSTLREVLELLEIPIRSTSNYIDFLPHLVYILKENQGNKKYLCDHLVTLLHDLTMNEFYKICIKFNYKLNDLILNARTFKLAKWVVDVAIAQQQQNHRQERI